MSSPKTASSVARKAASYMTLGLVGGSSSRSGGGNSGGNAGGTGGGANSGPSVMDQAIRYIDHILSSVDGLKVLLCDEEMKNTLSIIYTQRHLLQHQVVYVSLLSSLDRSVMKHLDCVVLARSTSSALTDLSHELERGHFASYHVFFTTVLGQETLQLIANADKHSLVKTVEEVFLDVTPMADNIAVVPLRPDVFSTGGNVLDNPVTPGQWTNQHYARVVDALASSMLLVGRRPVIRYRAGSRVAERIATDLANNKMRVLNTSFPDIRAQDCVLLIMERLDDPVTPLLTQWTYEAMIHELIGIEDGNKVDLSGDTGKKNSSSKNSSGGSRSSRRRGGANNNNNGSEKDPLDDDDDEQKKSPEGDEAGLVNDENIHILSPSFDDFFEKHRYADWGTLCRGIQDLVKEYKEENNLDRGTASLEEIKNFMHKFPEAKKRSLITTRHTSIVSHLADEVKARNLYKMSEVEQQLIEYDAVTLHSNAVLEIVRSTDTELEDAFRLTLLYLLRYENERNNIVDTLRNELVKRGFAEGKLRLLDAFINVATSKFRLHSLFKPKAEALFRGLVENIPGFSGNDVRNVFTLHQPLLKKLINRLYNGALNERLYPIAHTASYTAKEAASIRPKDIIVFIPGGVSHEEIRLVYDINLRKIDNTVESVSSGNFGKPGYQVERIGGGNGSGNIDYGSSSNATTSSGGGGGGGDAAGGGGDGAGGTGGSGSVAAGSVRHPATQKIECRVVIISTAVVSCAQFLESMLQY